MKCIAKGSLSEWYSNLLVSRTEKVTIWLRMTCLLLMAANGSDSNGNGSGIVMVLNGRAP